MKVKVTEWSALVQVVASTQQLTAHAGLVLVRELADRLGVGELLDRVTVKKRKRGYSPAQAILALCETLIAGGECLDDVELLRADSAQRLLRGHGLPEPTTLGRFLRRFTLGHLGQLNRALDELFARVHPLVGRESVTLDLDATYLEHHGPVGSRQGTRGSYKGKVCWHPLCCFVDETGEWLHAKLRNGHAAASTGATRFLRECLRRLPAGARVYLRADEGFWGQDFFAELEREQITYAVGAPLIASVRSRISEIAERDWQPSSYRDGSQVASLQWRPKSWRVERRFVVRRDPAEVGEQLSLEGREWHYWALATNDHERTADEIECWHRAKANLENRIKEAKLGLGLDNLPCASFHANRTYLLVTLLAYNLLAWLKLLALPTSERTSYAKRIRFPFIAVAATVGRSGRRLVLRLSAGYALLADFVQTLERIRALARAPARARRPRPVTHLDPPLIGAAIPDDPPPSTTPPHNPTPLSPRRPGPTLATAKPWREHRLNRLPQDPGSYVSSTASTTPASSVTPTAASPPRCRPSSTAGPLGDTAHCGSAASRSSASARLTIASRIGRSQAGVIPSGAVSSRIRPPDVPRSG